MSDSPGQPTPDLQDDRAEPVWAIRLGARSDGQRGTLGLTSTHLVFRGDANAMEIRIGLPDVLRVKSVIGSPVLIVRHRETFGRVDTAFYFAQPPPLPPPRGATARMADEPPMEMARPNPLGAFRRGRSRRKARAQSIASLAAWNKLKKSEVRLWRDRIRAAVTEAKGS
jgi:hypothetical protein